MKNIKILAVIFSVTLNIVFIGSYLYHSVFHITGQKTSRNYNLYEELNLSAKQLKKVKPLRNDFHAFINKQIQKIIAKRFELVELLSENNQDLPAIIAKEDEIQSLQHQMQSKVISHLIKLSRIFTSKQRKRFFMLIEKQIVGKGAFCPQQTNLNRIAPLKKDKQ